MREADCCSRADDTCGSMHLKSVALSQRNMTLSNFTSGALADTIRPTWSTNTCNSRRSNVVWPNDRVTTVSLQHPLVRSRMTAVGASETNTDDHDLNCSHTMPCVWLSWERAGAEPTTALLVATGDEELCTYDVHSGTLLKRVSLVGVSGRPTHMWNIPGSRGDRNTSYERIILLQNTESVHLLSLSCCDVETNDNQCNPRSCIAERTELVNTGTSWLPPPWSVLPLVQNGGNAVYGVHSAAANIVLPLHQATGYQVDRRNVLVLPERTRKIFADDGALFAILSGSKRDEDGNDGPVLYACPPQMFR